MQTTWIIIANTAAARIYSTIHTDGHLHLELVHELSHPESKMKGIDLVTDGSGKYRGEATGTIQGKYQPPTDPKAHEHDIFAREIVELLENARTQNRFGTLIIVADPHFHGLIDKHLKNHAQVNKLVKKHIQKNYINATEQELLALLRPF